MTKSAKMTSLRAPSTRAVMRDIIRRLSRRASLDLCGRTFHLKSLRTVLYRYLSQRRSMYAEGSTCTISQGGTPVLWFTYHAIGLPTHTAALSTVDLLITHTGRPAIFPCNMRYMHYGHCHIFVTCYVWHLVTAWWQKKSMQLEDIWWTTYVQLTCS